ncbi:Thiol:disulfide interchange protein DsbC [Aidingimonas halophila]|uniref:Thiol:disulfide interchange protein n=2 Tax=Aidingimonas halophila TaxID=574349 RepID=A0A1H2VST2_9GAMM|nr:DsbC family protein [Aidingimonas halophila]GHC24765.1 glutaredoxin [Aidingimonas halophila]SDW71358.1 Thiol:disulfide interchange protein DsbC [Aidingimonas halophila]
MRIPPLLAFGAFMLVALTGPSVQADPPDALLEDIEVNGEPMPVESVRDTPLPDIYHVRLENGETFYSDSEGKHFLVGDLYRNGEDGLVNLSEQGRNEERAARIATVPESERVIFRGVHDTKARVTVFTDATCPYCRKFHEEVPRLNEMGIAVHYLAFPRGGLSSEGGRELRQIWCADNRTEAMNAAKRDEALPDTEDCDNPVEDQYHLGMDIGVEGTPAIVLPDGRLVPGYVPAERLADMLGVSG